MYKTQAGHGGVAQCFGTQQIYVGENGYSMVGGFCKTTHKFLYIFSCQQ